jgi:hypothetical protein
VAHDYYSFGISAAVPPSYTDSMAETDREKRDLWRDLTDRVKAVMAEEKYRPLGVDINTDANWYEE